MDFRSESVDTLGTTEEDVQAIQTLLRSPRLAHIWFTLHVEEEIKAEESDKNRFLTGGLTASELVGHLDYEPSQSGLQDDLQGLVDIGAAQQDRSSEGQRYSAKFFQADTKNIDCLNDGDILNPHTIGLVGQAHIDDSVQAFLDSHSQEILPTIVTMFRADVRGDLDRDFVDMFPNIDDDELEAIVPAVKRILIDMSRHPDWGYDYRDDFDQD